MRMIVKTSARILRKFGNEHPIQQGILALVCFCAPMFAFQDGDAVFRTGVNLVLVDVSVLGSNGSSVAGLTRNQFEIRENGRPQEIARFDEGSANVSLALVVDYSGSMSPRRNALLRGMGALVTQVAAGDEGVLFSFNEQVQRLTDFQDKEELRSWVDVFSKRHPTGMTSLYDAVIASSRALANSNQERRAIIVLSDGKDTSSKASLRDAIDELRSANRLVYTVGLFHPGDPDTDAPALRKLAESTGGLALFDRDGVQLAQVFTTIIKDLRARYVLGFYSNEGGGEAEVRKLSVLVRDGNGRKLETRARREYRLDPHQTSSATIP